VGFLVFLLFFGFLWLFSLFFLCILYWLSLCILPVCSGAPYAFLMIFLCLPRKTKCSAFGKNTELKTLKIVRRC
jgi:hypothetical protein